MTTERFLTQKRVDIDLVVDQTHDQFRQLTDQAIGMATTLYLDVRLYEFFNHHYQSPIEYVEQFNYVLKQYGTTMPLYNAIQGLYFYTDNPSVLYSGGVRMLDQERDQEWYTRANQSSQPIIELMMEDEEEISLSVFNQLDYFYLYSDYETMIRIDISNQALRQAFKNLTLQGDLYLLDPLGRVVYTNNNEIDTMNNFDEIQFTNQHYLSKQTFTDNYLKDWQVIGVVDQSIFTDELLESSRVIIILALINFILPTLTIVFISRSFHSRLGKILKHMKKIEKQNFEEYPHAKSKDEIGQLARQINRMTRKVNQLFNEVFKANIEKKDLELKEKQAQLSALQSQINPHFLFNSLETIRMRSLIKGEVETANIIENMAGIFRNSLTWGKEWVPVEDEVGLIYSFLEIQAYRFGDKLAYQVEVDPQIKDGLVPNLSFLPFVENASIHGIEPLKQQGLISISIKKEEDKVKCEVIDDGVGMSEQMVEELKKQLEQGESMGDSVGIQNVYYRLKLYYKDNFTFNIESEVGKGTRVVLYLPYKLK